MAFKWCFNFFGTTLLRVDEGIFSHFILSAFGQARQDGATLKAIIPGHLPSGPAGFSFWAT
jgi:hypothetical protein